MSDFLEIRGGRSDGPGTFAFLTWAFVPFSAMAGTMRVPADLCGRSQAHPWCGFGGAAQVTDHRPRPVPYGQRAAQSPPHPWGRGGLCV